MRKRICKICDNEFLDKHQRTRCEHCIYINSKGYTNNPKKKNTEIICQTCGIQPARIFKSRGETYIGRECTGCANKKYNWYTGEGSGGKMKLLKYKKMVSERVKGKGNSNYGKPSPNRGKTNPKNAGENNWNWKGGITKERPLEERAWWRDGVYKKDRYLCQNCGEKGSRLNAHHILHYNNYPELILDVNNGITLCIKCHKEYHKIFGNNSTDLQPYLFFLWQQNIIKKVAL